MGDLTTQDVAAELRASTETVRNLIASRDLRAYRPRGERGPWRITPQALEAYREHQARRAADPWVRTRPQANLSVGHTTGYTWTAHSLQCKGSVGLQLEAKYFSV